MEGCSLEDAFEIPANKRASKIARREERERAKKCKGPALKFLEGGEEDFGEKDPDRQSLIKKKIPAPMKAGAFKERFVNLLVEEGANTPETSQEKRTETLPIGIRPGALPVQSGKPAYFGADPLEEGFASYDAPYTMAVDFKDSFQKAGLGAAGSGGKTMGVPSFPDVWGPLVPQGSVSSLLTGGVQDRGLEGGVVGDKELQKKLDTIFARLDDLESGRQGSEHAQSEILLFVMTGVFLLFSMDLLAGRR